MTAGAQVVDPKMLIQFKELEQESFTMSRQGNQDNMFQQQLSAEEADGLDHFTRRAEHQLDMLSLDGGGSLTASNLLSQSVPPKSKTNVVGYGITGEDNQISSYGQGAKREYNNTAAMNRQDKLTSSELLH